MNDLVDSSESGAVRYRTTSKGTDALWHFQQLEELIGEFGGTVGEAV